MTEAVYVPASATDDGELRVHRWIPAWPRAWWTASPISSTIPYECTEQTVSRFLPNLFTVQALRELGIDDTELEAQLCATSWASACRRLLSRQNPDGGWGYWPQEQSSPFITAYVLWGLWNADQMGYKVDAGVFDRAANYLDSQFVAPDEVTADWQLNEMAFMHYVLAADGPRRRRPHQHALRRARAARAVRQGLPGHGHRTRWTPATPRATTLADDLVGSAIVTATGAFWQDRTLDYQTMSTDVRSTAIVLDALLQITPDQPLLPNVVRWLMTVRENGPGRRRRRTPGASSA